MAPVFPEPPELVAGDLEPGYTLVVPDTELTEAERAHKFLGRVDLAELLGGDPIAVLEAGGQAGERGLVPRGQPELSRERANLSLPQLGLDQRRSDAALLRRLHARAMVAQIVHVRAVDERPAPLALGDRRQPGEELLLAEEAAVDRVLRVVRILQLLGAYHHVPHAEERAQAPRLLELARRIGLGIGRHQHRPRAERVL